MSSPSRFFYEAKRRGYDDLLHVKSDRVLLYLRQQLSAVIRYAASKSTKGLGDAADRIDRLRHEFLPLLDILGDRVLLETVNATLRGFNTRSNRTAAIESLRELSDTLEYYESTVPGDDPSSLRDRISELERQLTNGETADAARNAASVTDKDSVFVIMPFAEEFSDVWKGGIESASANEGFKPIRVDMINRSSNITDDIVKSIENCHLVIVDVTDNNPNVMFELGYALAKDKPHIIISQSAEYLPFDIRHIRTIVYENTWSGIEELRGRVQDFLKEYSPKKK